MVRLKMNLGMRMVCVREMWSAQLQVRLASLAEPLVRLIFIPNTPLWMYQKTRPANPETKQREIFPAWKTGYAHPSKLEVLNSQKP